MLRYYSPRKHHAGPSPSVQPRKRQKIEAQQSSSSERTGSANTSDLETPAPSPGGNAWPAAQPAATDTVTRQLQSVQRHFCSQALQTPQPGGNALLPLDEEFDDEIEDEIEDADSGDDSGDDGFMIHCSQVYNRTQSTQPCISPAQLGEAAEAEARVQPDVSPAAGYSSLNSSLNSSPAAANASAPSSAAAAAAAGARQQEGAEPTPAGGTAAAGHSPHPSPLTISRSCTPELGTEDEPGCDVIASQSQHGPQLFPMFKPKSQRKVIYTIRHGESTYNAATIADRGFADPTIFDAKLTDKGRQQAERLRPKLQGMRNLEHALWVVSPLRRALETFLLACPFTDRFRPPLQSAGESAQLGVFSEEAAAAADGKPAQQQQSALHRMPKLVILSTMAEHCATSGDVGSTPTELSRQFPEVAPYLADLKERWWYRPDRNCSLQGRLGARESMPAMRARVAEFRKFLERAEHKHIVCIGHSTFFKDFWKDQSRMANCELRTRYL